MTEKQPSLPPEEELSEEFVRSASGPGGQNVNKTATAVRLVWNFRQSSFLSDAAKERMAKLAGDEEKVIILAREFRAMPLNRAAARERLLLLITEAVKIPVKRKKTKPTRASQERRLKKKSIRSSVKAGRGRVNPE